MKLVCRVALMATVGIVSLPRRSSRGKGRSLPRHSSRTTQQPPTQQPTPPPPPPPTTQQPTPPQPTTPPEEQQKYEETVVVSASRTEEKLANAPVTMSVITAQHDSARDLAEFCGAAAADSRLEHDAGFGARHQRDQPCGHRNARDGPARPAGRPQPVPGHVRVRHVGLPAGEPERDQAD